MVSDAAPRAARKKSERRVILDDAITTICARTDLTPGDLMDLIAASSDPAAVAILMRVYAEEGRGPDLTGWQEVARILASAEHVAGDLAPLVGAIIAAAPLL